MFPGPCILFGLTRQDSCQQALIVLIYLFVLKLVFWFFFFFWCQLASNRPHPMGDLSDDNREDSGPSHPLCLPREVVLVAADFLWVWLLLESLIRVPVSMKRPWEDPGLLWHYLLHLTHFTFGIIDFLLLLISGFIHYMCNLNSLL
jgi:hypothetical protein